MDKEFWWNINNKRICHITSREAWKIATKLKAKNLIIVHTREQMPGWRVKELTKDAAIEFKGNIIVPNEGDILELKQIFNECWVSLVIWSWNWIWASYEIEEWEKETRGLGWKKIRIKEIKDIYFRLWIFKKVLVVSTRTWFNLKNKSKIWLKIIFWFSN